MTTHDWEPTTNTLATWECTKCGSVGFNPHKLPERGCKGHTQLTDLQLNNPDATTPVTSEAQTNTHTSKGGLG